MGANTLTDQNLIERVVGNVVQLLAVELGDHELCDLARVVVSYVGHPTVYLRNARIFVMERSNREEENIPNGPGSAG